MTREVDLREAESPRASANRRATIEAEALRASDRLPGPHRVRVRRFDAAGGAAVVASEAAPAEAGNYAQRALEHVSNLGAVLGFSADQPSEYVADPNIQRTSSGAVAVNLEQRHQGIRVFEGSELVRFRPDGSIKETVGRSTAVRSQQPAAPALSVEQAVLKAVEHVAQPGEEELQDTDVFGEPRKLSAMDVGDFEPKVLAGFPEKPERLTVLDAGPTAESIKANLIWFPRGDDLSLGWQVQITMPNFTEQYLTIVDAATGEILYCSQLVQHVTARGEVFEVDGDGQRQQVDFPRPLGDYGLAIPGDLPAEFPDDWVAADRTVGNNVEAHLGSFGPSIQGSSVSGVVDFSPSSATGDDQKVLNIFYYNCFMHDYFYLLGFRESDGNFQVSNLGRGGASSDSVDARAHSGAVDGTANMLTRADGLRPVMNMGLVESTNRHTAFDSSVVYHEFTHGVTNRLVGGPANELALRSTQSRGMGEGWSDYFACSINDSIEVGSWVVNRSTGIRGFLYDDDFPDDFGDLGTGRYTGFLPNGRSSPHPIGEIWCACLLRVNRTIGTALAVQLVFDALKLTPANPSFLDARDGILAALDDKLDAGQVTADEHRDTLRGLWESFARFGMGPAASSNGASVTGIAPDFNQPAIPTRPDDTPGRSVSVTAAPDVTIPDNQPGGVATVLPVAASGRLIKVEISIDIEHTFIGDLRVNLTAPSGSSVTLHDRAGGASDNLVATYSSDSLLALASLLGQPAQGDWTLVVEDLAGFDVGNLKTVTLDFELDGGTQIIDRQIEPGETIPDNDPAGISSLISVPASGTVKGIEVSIDVTHTFIGDLQVDLEAPSGESVALHERTGRGQDNLIRSYDSTTTPSLTTFLGVEATGDWKLQVRDRAGLDVGKLNRWGLKISI